MGPGNSKNLDTVTNQELERFENLYLPEPNTGCWLWLGYTSKTSNGYGRFYWRRKQVRAHRFAYLAFIGEISPGLVVDHVCRNRICVNPDHLRLVTPRQNTLENSQSPAYFEAARTSCNQGHPFSAENTYVRRRDGSRECRTCRKQQRRVFYIKERGL